MNICRDSHLLELYRCGNVLATLQNSKIMFSDKFDIWIKYKFDYPRGLFYFTRANRVDNYSRSKIMFSVLCPRVNSVLPKSDILFQRGTGTIQVPKFGGTSGSLFTRYRVAQPDNLYKQQKRSEDGEEEEEADMEGWAEWSATGLKGNCSYSCQVKEVFIAKFSFWNFKLIILQHYENWKKGASLYDLTGQLPEQQKDRLLPLLRCKSRLVELQTAFLELEK